MKLPGEIIESAPSRWGAPRLADLFRRAIQNRKDRTPEEWAELEAKWKADEEAAKEANARKQEALWHEHLQAVGCPGEVVATHKNRERRLHTVAWLAAERFLEEGRRFLVLSGYTGTGKSVAASLVFRKATRVEAHSGYDLAEWNCRSGLFYRLSSLRRLSDYSEEDKAMLRRVKAVRALVLDEVGLRPGELLGKHHQELLEEVIDARDQEGRFTVITTNLSLQRPPLEHPKAEPKPSPFRLFVGERISSRIGRSCILQDCGTKDLRRGEE